MDGGVVSVSGEGYGEEVGVEGRGYKIWCYEIFLLSWFY